MQERKRERQRNVCGEERDSMHCIWKRKKIPENEINCGKWRLYKKK